MWNRPKRMSASSFILSLSPTLETLLFSLVFLLLFTFSLFPFAFFQHRTVGTFLCIPFLFVYRTTLRLVSLFFLTFVAPFSTFVSPPGLTSSSSLLHSFLFLFSFLLSVRRSLFSSLFSASMIFARFFGLFWPSFFSDARCTRLWASRSDYSDWFAFRILFPLSRDRISGFFMLSFPFLQRFFLLLSSLYRCLMCTLAPIPFIILCSEFSFLCGASLFNFLNYYPLLSFYFSIFFVLCTIFLCPTYFSSLFCFYQFFKVLYFYSSLLLF